MSRAATSALTTVLVAAAAVGTGCRGGDASGPPVIIVTTTATTEVTETPTSEPTTDHPRPLRVGIAVEAVRHLASDVGPRHATSPAFRRSARWLAARFREAGYDVETRGFDVPGGNSWGVPVRAGRSANVIAVPAGLDPRRPHLVVGAHLDTVPQSPGAEDDASGIGVLLMLADSLEGRTSVGRLPVVLVGFGAEEPRGPTDADHHYGSRAYVADLTPRERQAVRGMVAMDRVGVGDVVPVCTAGDDAARALVLRAGRRAGVPTLPCTNTSSDHWSFVQEGMPGVRVGGTSYAGYHSPGDVPEVVGRAQLLRTARLVLAWIR